MLNKDIRVLQADKGNCKVVLDASEYKDKLNTSLEFVNSCPKTLQLRLYRNSFTNTKLLFLSI
jgi:hypothetical protein